MKSLIPRYTFPKCLPFLSLWCFFWAATSGSAQLGSATAQPPTATENTVVCAITFAVATLRQVPAADTDPEIMNFSDDGLSFRSVPIALIVQQAFSPGASLFLQDDLVVGLPHWAQSERYNIDAKVDDQDIPKWKAMSAPQRRLALQSLLVARLNIRFHHEARERPTYSLVIAKNGPKLQNANPNGAPSDRTPPRGNASDSNESTVTPGKIILKGTSLSVFASLLSSQELDHPVIDETGLAGKYDIKLRWTPENTDLSTASLPSLFTALEEQLGLKLRYNHNPLAVTVIDNIERPSPN